VIRFHWFRSSRSVFIEEHDIRYMQVSYLTALEKYQEESHQIVYICDKYYIVAIPNKRTGVNIVQWVSLHPYQEGSSSSYSESTLLMEFK
jgi:hypothetical protein